MDRRRRLNSFHTITEEHGPVEAINADARVDRQNGLGFFSGGEVDIEWKALLNPTQHCIQWHHINNGLIFNLRREFIRMLNMRERNEGGNDAAAAEGSLRMQAQDSGSSERCNEQKRSADCAMQDADEKE